MIIKMYIKKCMAQYDNNGNTGYEDGEDYAANVLIWRIYKQEDEPLGNQTQRCHLNNWNSEHVSVILIRFIVGSNYWLLNSQSYTSTYSETAL